MLVVSYKVVMNEVIFAIMSVSTFIVICCIYIFISLSFI